MPRRERAARLPPHTAAGWRGRPALAPPPAPFRIAHPPPPFLPQSASASAPTKVAAKSVAVKGGKKGSKTTIDLTTAEKDKLLKTADFVSILRRASGAGNARHATASRRTVPRRYAARRRPAPALRERAPPAPPPPLLCVYPLQETFLRNSIKVDGKKGALEGGKKGRVDIRRDGGKVTVESTTAKPFAKRYFKWLTKKYLKKNEVRSGRGRARARRLPRFLPTDPVPPSLLFSPSPPAAPRLPARRRDDEDGLRASLL